MARQGAAFAGGRRRTGLLRAAPAAGLALLLIGPVPPHAAAQTNAAPSFDCKAARSKPEKAICGSLSLSALDLRVALAYRSALARLDGPGQSALRRDQRLFLEARDALFGTPDYDLAADLTERATLLDRVTAEPRPGLAGAWGNAQGLITLAPRADGALDADIQTVALTFSHPTCQLEAKAVAQNGVFIVGGVADAQTEGWTVQLTRTGAALSAELLPPEGGDAAGGPPFCGHLPSITGSYLPIAPAPKNVGTRAP